MRLNVWQRLWVFVSVLYLVPVLWIWWPPYDVPVGPPVTATALVQHVREVYPREYRDLDDVQLEKALLAKYPAYANLPAGFELDQSDAINMLPAELHHTYQRTYMPTNLSALFLSLLPVPLLYALGRGIAWVRTGT